MPKSNKNQGRVRILEGRYANYFEIGHNAFEFLLDFGQLYLEEPEAGMHTRIVTSPVYAKRLAAVLQQALSQYEASYGRVAEEYEPEEDEAADTADRREPTGKGMALKII